MDNDDIYWNSNCNKKWTFFIRQLLVCSGVWPSFFLVGLCLGAPTVFVPQIRKEANSTEAVTDVIASWVSSTSNFASLPWIFILIVIAQVYGRKITMIFISLSSLIGFIIFYYSTSLLHIFICNGIIGISSASQTTTSLLILTEYTSPRYRGIFLTIKSASMFWGIWTANAIGTFFHWKNISFIGILCSIYALFSLLFWPESPYWLAKRRRFEECDRSHRWLKGCSIDSEHELKKLHNADVYIKANSLGRFFKSFMSNKLYRSVFISTAVIELYQFSGKLVCSIYAIDVIRNMTSSESTAYTGMLILDGVTVLSMYVGCVLSMFLNRRTQLLISSLIAVLSLFALSTYLYAIRGMIINGNKVVTLALLVIFSISICCGPIILATSISGELLPLKCRNFCVCIIAFIANISLASSLKFGPYVFETFGLDGAFLFYGVCSSILLFILFKYLPETKDKTLQEIQECLKGKRKKIIKINKLLDVITK